MSVEMSEKHSKRIGILTFHCADNFGAVLQAYALVSYLRDAGFNATIIDYRPQSITSAHGTFPLGRIRRKSYLKGKVQLALTFLSHFQARKARAKLFDTFRRKLPLSVPPVYAAPNELMGFDMVITGSDQVWNPDITGGFDPFYTGAVTSRPAWIGYSVSTDICTLNATMAPAYSSICRNYRAVSAREESLSRYLTEVTGRDVPETVDPAFLLTQGQWRSMAKIPKRREPYLLVYQVRRDDRVLTLAYNYAALHKLDVVEITAEADLPVCRNRVQVLSPEEFVGYFAEASGIITTSFHGTAFSILFRKPFTTVVFDSNGDNRSKNLIAMSGINDAITHISAESIERLADNYSCTALDARINMSKQFLLSSISH